MERLTAAIRASRLLDRAAAVRARPRDGGGLDAFLAVADARRDEGIVDVCAFLGETPHVVRWQFLCSLAARRRIASHGTGDPRIARFEPREPVDFAPSRLQEYAQAVMAAAPWP